MNTNPTVSRFVERAKIAVQPNTRAKADDEGGSYEFSQISHGHYACGHKDTTHILIEKDGKVGCSCGDMTYRCKGGDVCKHVAAFLKLDPRPQIPAPGELVKKLMLMGWVGGKDDLHPGELLRPPSKETTEHYECPKCGEAVDIQSDKLREWKLNHMDVCAGNSAQETVPRTETVGISPPANIPDDSPPATTGARVAIEPHPVEKPNMADAIMPSEHADHAVPPNLATALCNMQKVDLLAVADSDNPFHSAKYADLASVWAAIRKPLTDNGLAVIQTTEPYPDGITVVTTLVHVSGETFTSRLSCEVPKSKPDKNGQIKPNVQGLGSTITYLRRYSLAAMVGVAPIDDDGEAAMGRGRGE